MILKQQRGLLLYFTVTSGLFAFFFIALFDVTISFAQYNRYANEITQLIPAYSLTLSLQEILYGIYFIGKPVKYSKLADILVSMHKSNL